MSTAQIIWLVIAIVVVLLVVALVAAAMRRRRTVQHRHDAETLREEAAGSAAGLDESRLEAQRAQERAEQARLEAERAEQQASEARQGVTAQEAYVEDRVREADRMDPDVDHHSPDYRPGSPVPDPRQEDDSRRA